MKNELDSVDYYESLIAASLTETATEAEMKQLNDWRMRDSSHEEIYQNSINLWKEVNIDEDCIFPDQNQMWQNLSSFIHKEEFGVNKKRAHLSGTFSGRYMGLVACLCFILGNGIMYFLQDYRINKKTLSPMIIEVPEEQKVQLLLPDSTRVYLNSNSRLTYFADFDQNNRSVFLEGEGYFEVRKDSQHPFIVKTSFWDVVVYGTRFNVNTHYETHSMSVALLEGKVGIADPRTNQVFTYLRPDEQILLNRETMAFRKEAYDSSDMAVWRLDKLKFEGIEVEAMWRKLASWYGVSFQCSYRCPEQKENNYWLTVKNESLRELLECIHRITPIEYTIHEKEVSIRYL